MSLKPVKVPRMEDTSVPEPFDEDQLETHMVVKGQASSIRERPNQVFQQKNPMNKKRKIEIQDVKILAPGRKKYEKPKVDQYMGRVSQPKRDSYMGPVVQPRHDPNMAHIIRSKRVPNASKFSLDHGHNKAQFTRNIGDDDQEVVIRRRSRNVEKVVQHFVHEEENLELDGKNLVLDGQNLVLDGQNIVLDGQNVVLDGQNIVLDGQNVVLDGENVTLVYQNQEEVPDELENAIQVTDESGENVYYIKYQNENGEEMDHHAQIEAMLAQGQLEMVDGQLQISESHIEMTEEQMVDGQMEIAESLTKLGEGQMELPDSQTEMRNSQSEMSEEHADMATSQTEIVEGQAGMDEVQMEMAEGKSGVDEDPTEMDEGKSGVDEDPTEMDEGEIGMEDQTKVAESLTPMEGQIEIVNAEMGKGQIELGEEHTQIAEGQMGLLEELENLDGAVQDESQVEQRLQNDVDTEGSHADDNRNQKDDDGSQNEMELEEEHLELEDGSQDQPEEEWLIEDQLTDDDSQSQTGPESTLDTTAREDVKSPMTTDQELAEMLGHEGMSDGGGTLQKEDRVNSTEDLLRLLGDGTESMTPAVVKVAEPKPPKPEEPQVQKCEAVMTTDNKEVTALAADTMDSDRDAWESKYIEKNEAKTVRLTRSNAKNKGAQKKTTKVPTANKQGTSKILMRSLQTKRPGLTIKHLPSRTLRSEMQAGEASTTSTPKENKLKPASAKSTPMKSVGRKKKSLPLSTPAKKTEEKKKADEKIIKEPSNDDDYDLDDDDDDSLASSTSVDTDELEALVAARVDNSLSRRRSWLSSSEKEFSDSEEEDEDLSDEVDDFITSDEEPVENEFTLDVREERASDLLPMLGTDAGLLLGQERNRLAKAFDVLVKKHKEIQIQQRQSGEEERKLKKRLDHVRSQLAAT